MSGKIMEKLAAVGIAALLTFHPITATYAVENAYKIHTIHRGDTLWKISMQYGVSMQDIIKANHIADPDRLKIGQQLKIPVGVPEDSVIHKVKSGDTLWKIAERYQVSIQDIVDLNKINPKDHLRIGQTLLIPSQGNKGQEAGVHIVQWGDSIWKISVKYNVSIQDILQANHLTKDATIYVGQKIVIPAKSTKPYVTYTEHVVRNGDNVWKLANDYGIPMTELMQANRLTEQSTLRIGQKLTIPVHHVPVTHTPGPQYGEYLDWWTQAQYVFPIGAQASVTDVATGKRFNIVRSYGAFHADCEPLTPQDTATMYAIWGNQWSWIPRAVIVEYKGRRIAASASSMPHSIQNIKNNNFNGHFDIHFLNSRRHKDNLVSEDHQKQVRIAAGTGKSN